MAKNRSAAANYTIYLAIRVGVCIVHGVPTDFAIWVVESVAYLFFRLDRRHRETTLDNLRRAFPGRYREDQLHTMAFDCYRHIATLVLEVLLLPRKLTSGSKARYVNLGEYPRLKAVFDSGRPVIVLTAHYGNWELAAHCLGLAGIRSHLVARSLDNPFLDRWIRSIRELTGHKILAKAGDIRKMTEVLKAGEVICTLGDQDAGSHGMFVDFFGRPASSHKGIARLAQRTGAVIAVVGMQKTGGLLEYTLRVMDIIRPEDYPDDIEGTLAITQRYATGIEQMIRLDPVQYFWVHRRWKHSPPATANCKAA